jgi:hypothetical protein
VKIVAPGKNLEKLYRVRAALLSARAEWIMVNLD